MRTVIRYSKRPKVEEFAKGPVWTECSWMCYESVDDIPKMQDNCHSIGFVYVVEYGNMAKIGFAANPRDRFMVKYKPALHRGLEAGRVYISPAHRGYIDTENALHKHFAELRVPHTELFRIKFSDRIPTMMCMALEQSIFDNSAL